MQRYNIHRVHRAQKFEVISVKDLTVATAFAAALIYGIIL